MNIQGHELEALKGALKTIKGGKLRFAFISTHHWSISLDPNIHQKCWDYIKKLDGHIICEHSIEESFSGDGLIVASFFDSDRDIKITLSKNHPSRSLMRTPQQDIEIINNYLELNHKSCKVATPLSFLVCKSESLIKYLFKKV